MQLSSNEVTKGWLSQFQDDELATAGRLADAVLLVGRDELFRGLRVLLDRVLTDRDGPDRPLAFYAEREIEVDRGEEDDRYEVEPYFPGTDTGRAEGPGVPPFVPDGSEVGSEAPISNFITTYERGHRGSVLSHPGPDELRAAKVREIVIVTDFIGSGKRVTEQLEAFWRVATIRSWNSYKLVRFIVVAYSGIEAGIERVSKHRTKPQVLIVRGCPTIDDSFTGEDRTAVLALCRKYPKRERHALGFRKSGALIAFAHGMPNNAPAIFHRDKSGWSPLFPNRSAVSLDEVFGTSNADELARLAEQRFHIRLARKELMRPETEQWLKTMLVLAALEDGQRSVFYLSAQTKLPYLETTQILRNTRIARWTSANGALTDLGRRELTRLRLRRERRIVLPTDTQPFYYPSQLRAQ